MEIILEEGPLEGVHWLREKLGDERIKQYILTKGRHTLSAMTLNCWQTLLHFQPHERFELPKDCPKTKMIRKKLSFWEFPDKP
jgi:hypothetical protein